MCSCLFIISGVLPFARTMKKEDKEELYLSFKYFITLKKVQKYVDHVQRTVRNLNVFCIISRT